MRFLPALILFTAVATAQPVRVVGTPPVFVLDTGHSSYVLGVNELGSLQHVYWGSRVERGEDWGAVRSHRDSAFESRAGMTPEEYPAWGGMRYNEPCLKATTASGVRDVVLKYASHQVRGDALVIRLKDTGTDLFVNLTYRVYPGSGILSRQSEVENRTGETVTLESAQSAAWYLPRGNGYRLTHLAGRWAGETQVIQEPVEPGIKVLDSRRGNTSHQANPWFAIDESSATEDSGRVWFGALAWSGNWKLAIEQTTSQQLRVVGGYNTFDFSSPLKHGEALKTPEFFGGFTDRGFGEASRMLHRFALTEILPASSREKSRPVLYNSWEATTFNVNEAGQRQLAGKAAKLGIELFVMDDGWFGARDNDRAGLGDWYVNRKKFPNGLGPLISAVNQAGMKFGLWVEPEMVNPDSDLFRKHPDWAIQFPGRPRTEGRNQLILNMARNDVKEYIFDLLDKLLVENKIDFFKWDMNRHISEPGWPQLPVADQRKLYVAYVNNVYEIIDRLRAKHPGLEIESCSGGGGRIDLGIMRRVEQVWTSDNTEAFDRLRIQEGYSYAYPAKEMMAWVTDVPNMNGRTTPLKYRFLVAMMGSLGIGANLNHWSEADSKLAAEMIATYKEIRKTVQEGSLYRLISPRAGNLTSNLYVSSGGKQAALFAFLHSQQFRQEPPTIVLKGLEPNAVYRLKPVDEKLAERGRELSGAYLMGKGLNFNLTGDFDSTLVVLERVR
ncbi:MAG: alpha-galactosidase [Bryobacterales bacterium]|nr:alpha-galactosidase [Bryobacterales bacterium]